MFQLTNPDFKNNTLETPLGETKYQDWLLDEMSRIKSLGGEAVIKQDGELIYLLVTKLGPEFEKEKWPNCADNKDVTKGARF